MNTSTFSAENKSAEVSSLSRAIDLLDTYDPGSFIDAVQAVKFKNKYKDRYGLPLANEDTFWDEVLSSLRGGNSKR